MFQHNQLRIAQHTFIDAAIYPMSTSIKQLNDSVSPIGLGYIICNNNTVFLSSHSQMIYLLQI